MRTLRESAIMKLVSGLTTVLGGHPRHRPGLSLEKT